MRVAGTEEKKFVCVRKTEQERESKRKRGKEKEREVCGVFRKSCFCSDFPLGGV